MKLIWSSLLRLCNAMRHVDRELYLIATGAAALLLSALLAWPTHPSATRSSISLGELRLSDELYGLDVALRLLVWLVGWFFLRHAWCHARVERWHLRLVWAVAAAILAYPVWIAQVYPERMAEQRLLYEQLNRVANDIDANLVEQQNDWRAWQTFSQGAATPTASESEPLAAWRPATFSPSQAHRLLEDVLGYSPQFLGFVRVIWFAALWGGLAVLLLGLGLARGPDGWSASGWELRFALAVTTLLVALPLAPRVVAEVHLVASEQAARRGEPSALAHLEAARDWNRALGYSFAYYRQLGNLLRTGDRPGALAVLLADAGAHLDEKRPQEALERVRLAHVLYPEAQPVVSLLAVTLVEAGIDALDRGQITLASDYWEEALVFVPTNPTPWYGLSLVYHRRRQHDAAARCLDQVVRLQAYLGYRRLPVRSQALVAKSWAAMQRGDLAAAHDFYSRSLRPETW